jgi:predicted PurR-regulated permease PerM
MPSAAGQNIPAESQESSTMDEIQRDLTQTVLAVLFIGGLIGASLWILRPFLGAIIWATMIVVATWPAMLAVQRYLWGKRALAVTVMTLALLSILVVPFSLGIDTILANVETIVEWVKSLAAFKMPPPPAWLGKLPLLGARAVQTWKQVAAAGIEGLAARAAPYAGNAARWFVAGIGGLGVVLLQFMLIVVFSAILYARGEGAAAGIVRFARRLAGSHGENAVYLAGQAIRAVALGVVVTAIAQSVLGGIGLAISGVPYPGVLTAVMFMLAVAQLGPILVLAPAVVWLYWSGSSGWGTFLLLWTLVVGTMDNFVRPLLIKKGADLPLLLIFAGVIGGLVAFGVIGIFVGPVVLAVAYTLLDAWVRGEDAAARPAVD